MKIQLSSLKLGLKLFLRILVLLRLISHERCIDEEETNHKPGEIHGPRSCGI